MNILFAPTPPRAIREQAERLLPAGHSLSFASEDSPDYSDALKRADVLLGVPRRRINEEYLQGADSLRMIQLLRKGVDKVDFTAVEKRGIDVATIGDLTAPFVAEHTISMLLALGRGLFPQHQMVQEGRWTDAKPWQKPNGLVDTTPYLPCTGVYGRSLGLLGMGSIGTRVAQLGLALGMRVQATTRGTPGDLRDGIELVSLETLLASSDFISVHLTLTAETRNILDRSRIAKMRPGVFLINTARGELLDREALIEALESGQVAGAGLDTLPVEPPAADDPLLSRSDVIFSPHSGWLSSQSWETVLRFGFDNIGRFAQGEALTFKAS